MAASVSSSLSQRIRIAPLPPSPIASTSSLSSPSNPVSLTLTPPSARLHFRATSASATASASVPAPAPARVSAEGVRASQQSPAHGPGLLKSAGAAASAAALAASLLLSPILPPPPAVAAAAAVAPAPISNPALSELSVLINSQPVKDAKALLRYALPIDNQPIKDIQFPLELISEDLRLPGVKALEPAERHIRQAARVLNQNTEKILADVAEGKREEARQLLDTLQDELQEMQRIIGRKERALIPVKQRELLAYVGDIEEAMVKAFPFEIPEEFQGMPWLKGRATLEMVVNPRSNPNLKEVAFQLVVDGYNAPITAGNFVDLVQRKFYDGLDIQRADGFVVQTGDPEGKEEGFVDPSTGKVRRIPLEIFVEGDKAPLYHETTEDLGRYKAIMTLPFNAFGTMAMARDEFDNDSASSQIFWLLKESELTPSSANILDGRYAVFGYITENEEYLADLKVGDTIKSIRVTQGLDNLQNPSF